MVLSVFLRLPLVFAPRCTCSKIPLFCTAAHAAQVQLASSLPSAAKAAYLPVRVTSLHRQPSTLTALPRSFLLLSFHAAQRAAPTLPSVSVRVSPTCPLSWRVSLAGLPSSASLPPPVSQAAKGSFYPPSASVPGF
ncbi:hypothetical protein C1H46_000902 [Malus baccata]|uniref:Uncharacterized protein n=1 Tax=Malus baccata TaxID=106549 RepID=A0A540NRC0_MALBA|nr:hypothetical protein C1H46_000902 [Malus baccata]